MRSDVFTTLVTAVDGAYEATFPAVPKPLNEARDLWIWNTLAVSHRSFLIAASLIGRGHPDDSVGTTRCALEGARTAFAVRYQEDNWTKWAAYEERFQRWKDRERDTHPRPMRPKLNLPLQHEHLEQVGKWRGMLSDTLHFTPEFMGNHAPEMRAGEAFVHYFTDDTAELDRAVRCLAAVHLLILNVFDAAFGGAFSRSPEWCETMRAIGAAGARFSESTPQPLS